MNMYCFSRIAVWVLVLSVALSATHVFATATVCHPLAARFEDPPDQYRSRPLYWLNAPLDPEALEQQVTAMRETCGFGGFAPLTLRTARPEYLTEDYFTYYGRLLELAESLGLKVIFYDDLNFPTGTAGGRMRAQYPDHTLKNLQKTEHQVDGPKTVSYPVPSGSLMAAVAMETQTLQRLDLSDFIQQGTLNWDAPVGTWKVMFFVCVDGGTPFVDYLDAQAVKKWMSLTYDQFYKRFARHFGTTITMSFYDDPAMVYTAGARTWTPSMNSQFKDIYGTDPAILYPALWYDIGSETEAARVALFGLRAELMAKGLVRTIQQWCAAHGIQVTGHPAGNYEPQPTEVSGDNIKHYKYSDVPLVDVIHYYTHGRDGFKLPISAAFNYDRPVTAVEIYGNFPDNSVDASMLYRAAMELYVRGANMMIPHGMWYEPSTMHIPPEFSHRNVRFGAELPAYNTWVARCSMLLQGGRHVADIGVLYPVQALQAAYQFDVRPPNWGKDAPWWADYLRISDRLTGSVRRDFTFLHPEVIDERCSIEGTVLRLNNTTNWEEYSVVIIPGGEVISWGNLQKLQQFYENGGRIIATTQLPFKSAEFGHDADVKSAIEAIFGITPRRLEKDTSDEPYRVRIEISGSTIKTYVRDVLVDVTQDESFSTGGIGFRAGGGGEMGAFSFIRVSSPDGQTLFEEDFSEGLEQWIHTDNVRIVDGQLLVENNERMRSRVGANWTDYIIETELDTQHEPVGLVFRSSDNGMNRYMWQFWPGRGQLRPHKMVDGRWWVIKDVPVVDVDESLQPIHINVHPSGGRSYFTEKPTTATLQAMLDDAVPVADVAFEGMPVIDSGEGMLSYLHKVKEDRHLYYFANSSNEEVDVWVRLRGKRTDLKRWDPHDGAMLPQDCEYITVDGQDVTRVRLMLDPLKSLFLTGPVE